MEEQSSPEIQNSPVTAPPPIKGANSNLIKYLLAGVLVVLAVGALVFVGVWYGRQMAKDNAESAPLKKFQAPSGNQPEVSEGDEFNESQAWKEAVDKTTEDYKKNNMLNYTSDQYGFKFYYLPSEIFVEEDPQKSADGPVLFVDTKAITIPKAYGGPLTPVEISVTNQSLDEALIEFKNPETTDKNSYSEKELPPNLKGKGVWATAMCLGFPCNEEYIDEVILTGSKGTIKINYYPSANFSYKLFDQLLLNFELL